MRLEGRRAAPLNSFEIGGTGDRARLRLRLRLRGGVRGGGRGWGEAPWEGSGGNDEVSIGSHGRGLCGSAADRTDSTQEAEHGRSDRAESSDRGPANRDPRCRRRIGIPNRGSDPLTKLAGHQRAVRTDREPRPAKVQSTGCGCSVQNAKARRSEIPCTCISL
jgi:hypothetical protein